MFIRKSQQHCRCVWSGLVWSALFCTSFLLTAPGVRALKFLQDPPSFQTTFVGLSFDFNCTTDDPNATVSLLFSATQVTWRVLQVSPNKLLLRKQVFTKINLVLSDGGYYKCKATDQPGQTIEWPKMQWLHVSTAQLPRHFVLKPNKSIIVLQGQSGEVTCEAEGPLVSTLKWEKEQDDKSYAAVSNSQVNTSKDANYVRVTLKITNAQFADTGIYKCTVSVPPDKSHYKRIKIDVKALSAPSIRPYKGQTEVLEGSTKDIKCVTEGSPKPTVDWYRNGKKMNVTNCHSNPQSCDKVDYEVYEEGDGSSGLHTIHTVKVLKIRSALYPRDVGEFKCVASNGVSPDAKLIVSLDVQVSPTIEKRGSEVSIEEGKEATISCRVTKSNPLPTFTWHKRQYAFKTSRKEDRWNTVPGRLILTNSSTPSNESIVKVEKGQQDEEYRCQARNSLGRDFYVFRLARLAKKLIIDTGNTLTEVNEKSTLHVYCIATDLSYGLLDVVFSKDGEKIQLSDPRVNVTFEQLLTNKKQFDLTIKNVSLNDTGHYGCTTDKSFPKLLSSINITVKALKAPHISDIPDVRVVQKTQGGNAELHCDVTGNPEPSITWYFSKNGKIKEINREKDDLDGDKDNCKSRKSGYYFLQPGNPRVLVICNPQFEHHEGKYWCRANNTEGSQNRSAFVNVKMAPVINEPEEGYAHLSLKIGEPLNISCVAIGNPAPSVTWLKNSTGKAVSPTSTNSQRLIIKSMKDKDFGLYSCIASNNLSHTMASVDIKKRESIPVPSDRGLSTGTLVGIAIGVSVFVLIVLVVCCYLYHRQKKQIDEYKQLYFLKTSSDYKIDPDRSLLQQCNDLPYDPDWEFPEERLILGNVLGAGAFGQVVEAEAIGILALNPRDKSAESFKRRSKIRRSSRAKDLKKEGGGAGWKNVKVPVAVKTLKDGATEAEYKDLASELKILIHLGQHKNIINLLGACTKGKRLMVIMEFAPHGSLLNFLRARRDTYEASSTKTMNEPEKEFTLVDLVMIGFQVGRGMSFLASKKCVHRDLAARNILVGDDYVMKIADFGLARDIYKDDQYVKNTQGLLPVKWMAPESLFDRVYTEKTDVWSFGILLWETFTLGGTPYPGLPTEQLLDYLSDGKRMDMPTKCPLEVYTIMRDCWIHEPEQRPHFITLTERLAKILEKHTTTDNPYLVLQMDEEVQPSTGYYLQPVDNAGVREFKRYVKSPVQSPTSDTQEPPQFGDLEGGQYRYDSPLPTLPPGLPAPSDDEIPTEPLPQIPPPFENDVMDERRFLERENSAGWESGIDMDPTDDGYVDDIQAATPFLPRTGYTLVGIDMEKVSEPNVLSKGNRQKAETSV